MQIKKENIVLLPLKKIRPYKNNAKKHPKEQVERIAKSIERFGFTIPILVDGSNTVIAGHGRCLAAKMLGIKEVPCLVKETWTEEEVKAYRLIDNKTNEGNYDFNLIDMELEKIIDIDMSDFGFINLLSDEELEDAMEKEVKFKVKEKHLVIVECESEQETLKVQKKLQEQGYKCEVKNT